MGQLLDLFVARDIRKRAKEAEQHELLELRRREVAALEELAEQQAQGREKA